MRHHDHDAETPVAIYTGMAPTHVALWFTNLAGKNGTKACKQGVATNEAFSMGSYFAMMKDASLANSSCFL